MIFLHARYTIKKN